MVWFRFSLVSGYSLQYFASFWKPTSRKQTQIQPGAVKLVHCRHGMNLAQVHPVTSENQSTAPFCTHTHTVVKVR